MENFTSNGLKNLRNNKKKIDKLDKTIDKYKNALCKCLDVDIEKLNDKYFCNYGYIQDLIGAINKISLIAYSIITETQLISDNTKPYIMSILAHPFIYFVYNEKGDLFIWETIDNIVTPPQRIKLSKFLNINVGSAKIEELESVLCNLLKEYNRYITKEYQFIQNFNIYITKSPCKFYINLERQIQNTEQYFTNNFNEVTLVDVMNNLNNIPDTPSKPKTTIDEVPINGAFIKINIKIKNKSFDFVPIYVSNKIINPYFYNRLYNKNDAIFNYMLCDIGLSPFKQNLFEICYSLPENLTLDFYNLKNSSYFYNNNVVILCSNNYTQLLNDALFYIVSHQLNLNLKGNKIKSILKEVYKLIYKFTEENNSVYKYDNNIVCPIYKYGNNFYTICETHNYIPILYQYDVINLNQNLVVDHKINDTLSSLIEFMTNNNINNFKSFIRILSTYFTKKEQSKMGYLICNCSDKIFELYKLFFKKLKLNSIIEVNSITDISKETAIFGLIGSQICCEGPIFINDFKPINKDTYIKQLKKLFSGKEINIITDNILSESGYMYGNLKYKNNIPILIYSPDQKKTDSMLSNFNDYLYKLDFRNKQISDNEFEKYKNIIDNLNNEDITFILNDLVSYGLNPDNISNEKESIPLSTEEMIKDFCKNCCKKSDDSDMITTEELFKVFQAYAYKNFNIYFNESKKSDFSKKFKKVSKFQPYRKDKIRGYKGFKLAQTTNMLNDDEINKAKNLDEINGSKNAIKEILKNISDNSSTFYVLSFDPMNFNSK